MADGDSVGPTRWTAWHGGHVVFHYNGPTAGSAVERRLRHSTMPLVASRVEYSSGRTATGGELLRCDACNAPVWVASLKWEERR